MYDTIIIGGGVAGLAAALRLRKRGDKVLVLEKNAYVGGKMNAYQSKGYRWDTGPSLFTIPMVVDELYELYGRNPRDYYNYNTDTVACRYFFRDGLRTTFYTDRTKLKEEIQEKFGDDAKMVDTYLDKSREKFESLGEVFLQNSIHKVSELPWGKLAGMAGKIARMDLFKSLNQVNQRKFKDPHLIQIFNRYTTYNGSNPYEASGVYSMIAHLEQNIGTFFPIGGMRAIPEGFYRLGQEVGVEYELGVTIQTCAPKAAGGYTVTTEDRTYEAKRVVCAVDCVQFYQKILKDDALYQKYSQQESSTSALIFYMGVKKSFPELGLHNIFFSEDYQEEFKILFKKKEVAVDGTVYVHISSKLNPEDAPEGGENWFVMMNVPAGIEIEDEEKAAIREAILTRLEKALGKDIKPYVETELSWKPTQIAADTGAYLGAVYGAASNRKTAALTRHPNFSRKYKDLYFCGGTVHPGGGIPLAIQSAKIVDKLIAHER